MTLVSFRCSHATYLRPERVFFMCVAERPAYCHCWRALGLKTKLLALGVRLRRNGPVMAHDPLLGPMLLALNLPELPLSSGLLSEVG